MSGATPIDQAPTLPAASDRGEQGAPRPPLTPAAQRALAEAEARRVERDKTATDGEGAKEVAGRGGLEPTRYGDWEINGLTSDF
jgi:hypothetical protein